MAAINIIDKKKLSYGVKDIQIEKAAILDVSTSGRTVTGFFSTFNVLDSDNDVLRPGCFKKSINERGVNSDAIAKIKHAMFHDLTRLPGKLRILEEKKINKVKGLYFETEMATTQEGNDALVNYQMGIYDNHSIGFKYLWDKIRFVESNTDDFKRIQDELLNPEACEGIDGLYEVSEVKLYEGSTVTFGANSLTPVLGMKSLDKDSIFIKVNERIDKLCYALKNGTQSDDMMELFEVQALQLKQLLSDLDASFACKGCKPKDPKPKGLNYNYIIDNIKF